MVSSMETVASHNQLQTLKRTLQERLHSELPVDLGFQVQCLLKQGTLLVLAQHQATTIENPQQVFKVLQQTILAQPSQLSSQARLFLRVAGEKQPYAGGAFTISSQVQKSLEVSAVESKTDSSLQVVETSASPSDEQSQTTKLSPEDKNVESAIVYLRQPRNTIVKQPAAKIGDRSLTVTNPERRSKRGSPLLFLLIAGLGIGTVCFASAFYAFTRPCTIGECYILRKAERLTRNVAQRVPAETNPQRLQLAQNQLIEATEGLETIPVWSSDRSRAQKLLQENRDRAKELELMVTAMDKGMAAALMSQNPPHSLEKWEKVKALWQEAIAPLLAITPQSYIYTLREEKLQEYSSNVAEINKRIEWEREAQEKLALAKRDADVAIALQGIAQSLEDWQRVEQTWEDAVNALSNVPQQTMAYLEAQQLLVAYQSGLASARSQHTKEEFSANTYYEAVYLANKARDSEQHDELSEAVDYWRQALTYARQVPSDTFHYAKTQPLISTYSASLASAETKLRVARNLETARFDLNRVCAGSPKICDYNLTDKLITVQLKRDYMTTVRETFITAGSLGNYDTLAQMDLHLESLRSALEAISNKTRIPLELYNHHGELMGPTYLPTNI